MLGPDLCPDRQMGQRGLHPCSWALVLPKEGNLVFIAQREGSLSSTSTHILALDKKMLIGIGENQVKSVPAT